MPKEFFVYSQDDLEPAVQRRALERGSTALERWRASEHSTFEQPSRASKPRRAHRLSNFAITMLLVAITAVSAGVIAVLR